MKIIEGHFGKDKEEPTKLPLGRIILDILEELGVEDVSGADFVLAIETDEGLRLATNQGAADCMLTLRLLESVILKTYLDSVGG